MDKTIIEFSSVVVRCAILFQRIFGVYFDFDSLTQDVGHSPFSKNGDQLKTFKEHKILNRITPYSSQNKKLKSKKYNERQ
jgi:hypothetical protein